MALPDGERREYSGGAVPTALAGDVSDVSTNIEVQDASTYPTGSVGWVAIHIDAGEPNAEVVWYKPRNGNTFQNCLRGKDGTQPFAHGVGATVEHVYTALDANEANRHVTDTSRHDHTQYIRKSVDETIDADHTFSGAVTHTGSTDFEGDVTSSGDFDIETLHADEIYGPVNFTGNVNFQGDVEMPWAAPTFILSPLLSGDPSAGIQNKVPRADHRHVLDMRLILRALVPAGTIREWCGENLPSGALHAGEWMWTDGATIAASSYPEYSTNVGIKYGGTNSNPRLPNGNGRVLVGADTAHVLGTSGGSLTHTQTTAQLAQHGHTLNDPGHKHAIDGDTGNRIVVTAGGAQSQSLGPAVGGGGVTFTDIDVSGSNISMQQTGSSQPMPIEQPWLAVKYIVKVH